MPVCPHLAPILAVELAAGNRVERTFENGYTRCRLQVTLAEPFHIAHEEGPLPAVVTPHDDTDSHYPLGKGYYCSEHLHDVFASAPGT